MLTKISVQILFQRNELREWSIFIAWEREGGEDFNYHVLANPR